jgi:hypothetical protein
MSTVQSVLLAVKALLLLAVILVGIGWWYEYTGTPQHSLALLADAVKTKDYETARYFVDDERIADTGSKSFLDAAMDRATKEMKADDNPLSGFGIAALQMMAPRLRETAKDRIKDSIRQALSGDDTLTDATTAQRWDTKRFSQLRIEECAVSGNTAEVVLRGIPQPNPAQITEVHLRMARIPDSRNWRIEEIPELAQALVKTLDSNELQKASAKSSADTPNASVPAVTVSKPNRVLEQITDSVCRVDFRNSRMFLGDDWSAALTNGSYEKHADLESQYVDLKNLFCFDGGAGSGERTLVTTEWRGCGADCQITGVVQVFELRNSHPAIIQQIEFDSKAQGTGATFDPVSLTLTVTGRGKHEEDEAECCPKNLDIVTYRWEGQQFVQSSYKRVPVPPT